MKLHLPTGLRAALIACFAAFAGLGTTLSTATITGGVFAVALASAPALADTTSASTTVNENVESLGAGNTYSGLIYTLDVSAATNSTITVDMSASTVTFWRYLEDGTDAGVDGGSTSYNGGSTVTNDGADVTFWRQFHNDNSKKGNTLRLSADKVSSSTSTINVSGSWDSMSLGGLIVEKSDKTWVVGRVSGSGTSALEIVGNGTVVFSIGADTTLRTGTTASGYTDLGKDIKIYSNVDCEVVAGKTLTMTAVGTGGSVVLTENVGLSLSKAGSDSGTGALTFASLVKMESGSSISVGAGTSATFAAGLDLASGAELTNSGALTLGGNLALAEAIKVETGGTVTLNSGLTFDLSALTPVASEDERTYTFSLFTGENVDLSGLDINYDSVVTDADGPLAATWLAEWVGTRDGKIIATLLNPAELEWGAASGNELNWQVGTTFTTGGDYVDGSIVTLNTGASLEVTLTGNVVPVSTVVSSGTTVTLDSAEAADDGLYTIGGRIEVDGVLTLKDTVLAEGARIVAGSEGVVVIDVGTKSVDTSVFETGYTGALTVQSGALNGTEDRFADQDSGFFSSLVVEDGAQFNTGDHSYTGHISVSGKGLDGAEPGGAGYGALNLGNTTLWHSGSLTTTGDTATTSTGYAYILCPLAGSGTLMHTSNSGTLYICGDISHTGEMTVAGGTVSLGYSSDHSGGVALSGITVESGATLELNRSALTSSATVTLNGGTLYCNWIYGSRIAAFKELHVEGEGSKIQYYAAGTFQFDTLTGSGDLNINLTDRHNAGQVTNIAQVKDYHGTISVTTSGNGKLDYYKLVLGTVNQAEGLTATVVGTVVSEDFMKLGKGAFEATQLDASVSLNMNYEGTLTLGTVNVADGTILRYDTSIGSNLISISSLAEGVTVKVDVTNVLKDMEKEYGIDLGIEVVDGDADALAAQKAQIDLSVLGSAFTADNLVAHDGTWHLQGLASKVATEWDFNWGVDELYDQPDADNMASLGSIPSNYTYLATDYLEDGLVAVTLTGTAAGATNVIVVGGAGATLNEDKSAASSSAAVAVTANTWMNVTGGSYYLLVGGNYANNWSSGTVANFTGNSHIKLDGENVVVDYIVGGNYKDALCAAFNGDSYISVFNGALRGSIIGGGTMCHSDGVNMKGSSHIFVYTLLTNDSTVGGLNGVTPNAIIGANLYCTNVVGSAVMRFGGDTELLVSLQDSASGNFEKMLVGGDYFSQSDLSSTLSGSTHVTVEAPTTATFTAAVIGGTYQGSGGTSSIGGDSMVELAGGTYSADITAGSRVKGSSSSASIGGGTYLTISGGTFGSASEVNISGAGHLVGTTNASTGQVEETASVSLSVGDGTHVVVNGGSFSNAHVYGGYFIHEGSGGTFTIDGTSEMLLTGGTFSNTGCNLSGGSLVGGNVGNVQFTMGDLTLTVEQAEGSTLDVQTTLHGGSINWKGSDTGSTISQGNISLELKSGKLSSVYAAGKQAASATMTTASTTVNVSSDVTFYDGAVVSGGYNGGDATNALVTGTRTLVLADAAYSNLGNVTLKDFNVIDIQNASANIALTQTVTGMVGDATATLEKKGAGTLTLGGADTAGTLMVTAGTLALNGSTLTATTVLNDSTLDASSASSRVGALTLGDGAADAIVKLNLGDGLALDTLTLAANTKMEVVPDSVDLTNGYTLTLFTGLTASNAVTGITFIDGKATLADYIANGDLFEGAELLLTNEGSLVISNQGGASSWVWNTPGAGTWEATSTDEWLNPAGDTPDAQVVVFGNDGVAAGGTTTVTISGAVAPSKVMVNAGAGDYVFTGDSEDDGITGEASLVKSGAGKLTISLANDYSGGTIITDGTLEVTVTGALGSGKVELNGGTLAQGAALDNEIVLGDGKLCYTETISTTYSVVDGTTVVSNKLTHTEGKTINVEVVGGKTATWESVANDMVNMVGFFGDGLNLTGAGTLKLLLSDYKWISDEEAIFNIDGNLHLHSNNSNASRLHAKLDGSGTLTLTGSLELLGDSSAFTEGTLVLNGTTLYRGSGSLTAKEVQVKGSNTLDTRGSSTTIVNAALKADAVTEATDAANSLAVIGNGKLVLAGDVSGFAGTLSINNAESAVIFGAQANEAAIAATPDAAGNLFAEGATLTGTGEAHYQFKYDDETLNLNATLSGAGTQLSQNGSGTLVLTKTNDAEGKLTVNSGAVAIGSTDAMADWKGAIEVKSGATLKVVNVTDKALGAITAAADAKVNVTGATAEGEAVTLASISGGVLTTTGNVAISNSSSVNGLDNAGTIELAAGKGFTIQGGTTNGGNIVADQIAITGDSTFGSLTVNNTDTALIANNHNLKLNGDSTFEGKITGVKDLTINADVTVKTGDVSVAGALAGTGSLEVTAGALNLNRNADHELGSLEVATLTLNGTLEVTGTLSGLTTLELVSSSLPEKPGPVVTAGTFSSSALNVLATSAGLEGLGLGNDTEYKLVETSGALDAALGNNLGLAADGAAFSKSLTLGGMVYTIGLSTDGMSIVLTTSLEGSGWTSTDGTWGGTDVTGDWAGDAPSGLVTAVFSGEGTTGVKVDAAQTVQKIVVNTSSVDTSVEPPSGNKAYTFSGEGITTGALAVTSGQLTVENTMAVVTDNGWTGVTVIGSAAENALNDARLDVKGSLTTDSLTMWVDTTASSGLSVASGAKLTVTNALSAEGKTIANAGTLTVGNGTKIGSVTGTGTLAVAGDGTTETLATIGSVETGATLSATTDKSTLQVASIGGTAGSFNGTLAEVSVATGGMVELTGASGTNALTVEKLSGAGTFSAAGVDVTLTSKAEAGTSLTAQSLTLEKAAVGSTLGVVTADAFTFNLAALADPAITAQLSVGKLGNTAIDVTLAGTEADMEALVKATMDAFTLNPDATKVDYLLLTQSDADASDLMVTLTNADAIRQAFALAGKYDAALLEKVDATSLFATAVAVGKDVVLRVGLEDERVWNTGDVPEHAGALAFDGVNDWYTRLQHVDRVNVTADAVVDLTDLNGYDSLADADGLAVRNLGGDNAFTIKGSQEDVASLENNANTALNNTLTVEGIGEGFVVTVDATDANHAAILSVDELVLAGGATLEVKDSGNLQVGKLTAADAAAGTLSGEVSITGAGGSYAGSYANAIVNMAAADASQRLAPAAGLKVTGSQGTAILDYTAGPATMGSLATTGARVQLDNMGADGKMHTLTLSAPSSMQQGELAFGVNAADIANAVNSGTAAPVITNGAALSLSGTTLAVTQADTSVQRAAFDVTQGTEGITLFTVSEDGSLDGVTISFGENDAFFSRYFRNVQVKGGKVVADLVTDYYSSALTQSANGGVGLQMMDTAFLQLNPLGANDAEGDKAEYKDLAGVLHSLEDYMTTSNADAADQLGAAVAGSGVASLGMAVAGDVERQLKAIRNRTTTMGVDPSVVNEDMPYFNAWINAEGDYRSLDEDGTLAGYTLSSWGGTVGFDMDVNPNLTWGLALTAMYGDFNAESADVVDADMENYYVSAFARATRGAWVHTFVATIGMSKSDISRTVSHAYGSYTAEGEADGMSFGLLYELARTFALNEDATACWQPVVNVAYRHVALDGFSETGSDAALSVGDQTFDTVTFGIGGRIQAVVGENIYNRTSVFEGRALVKVDAGDRSSEMETAFVNAPMARGVVESAEVDAVGLELGVGLTIPMGIDSGSLFMDGSIDFRGSYTSANATLGYRVNF